MTEGKVTEPQYLKGLISLFRATAVDVVAPDVKPSKRTDPAGLVREALRELPPAFPYLDWEKAKERANKAAPGARLNVVGPNPSSLVGELVEAMKAGGS